MNTPTLSLDEHDNHLIKTMQLLGDSTRFKIFKLMLGNSEFCVSEMASKLGISSPAVSQHIRIFELVGFVSKKRVGQKICYTLKQDDKLVKDLINFVNN